jgi:hypothetical protein
MENAVASRTMVTADARELDDHEGHDEDEGDDPRDLHPARRTGFGGGRWVSHDAHAV